MEEVQPSASAAAAQEKLPVSVFARRTARRTLPAGATEEATEEERTQAPSDAAAAALGARRRREKRGEREAAYIPTKHDLGQRRPTSAAAKKVFTSPRKEGESGGDKAAGGEGEGGCPPPSGSGSGPNCHEYSCC